MYIKQIWHINLFNKHIHDFYIIKNDLSCITSYFDYLLPLKPNNFVYYSNISITDLFYYNKKCTNISMGNIWGKFYK